MTRSDEETWRINIENATAMVADQYGIEVVASVFQRYNAHGLHDLNPCYFAEVFGDLSFIMNDR